MACELMSCCQLFRESLKNLPKTAAYIREKLCTADHESCNRYRAYLTFGKECTHFDLDPSACAEVEKIIACLRAKRDTDGS